MIQKKNDKEFTKKMSSSMPIKKPLTVAALILLCLTLSLVSCKPEWSFIIQSEKDKVIFTEPLWELLFSHHQFSEKCSGLDAEIVLYSSGYEVIEEIQFLTDTGERIIKPWKEIAGEICISESGKLNLKDKEFPTKIIDIDIYESPDEISHITDIAPSIISAFNIEDTSFQGESLVMDQFSRVVLIIWDAFGWNQYQKAKTMGQIPNLDRLSAAIPAVTIYPPRTSTATAALITGLYPDQNGVDRRGIRGTSSETIFDVLSNHGYESLVIEGESLPFTYQAAEVILSGDRNQDKSTDDNVFENVNHYLGEDLVDFLMIHFHGIDDLGHQYGPDHYLVEEKISELDRYLIEIYQALPMDTLIILTADHGMHSVKEEDNQGNHGNLIEEDMLIPIFIIEK